MPAVMISISGYSQSYHKKALEYYYMGCDMMEKNNYQVAVNDFAEAISIDPLFKEAYENRGVARFRLNDIRGAIEDYNEALEMDPNDFSTYGRRGWAKYVIRDYPGAIEDLTMAVQGAKYLDKYYNMRGEARYQLRDYEGAIADFSRVTKSFAAIRSEKATAYFWRAMSLIELGQKDNACSDLHMAARKGYMKAYEVLRVICE